MSDDDEFSVGVVVPAPGTGGCAHGRKDWRWCPHCNGTNTVTVTSVDLQARINKALRILDSLGEILDPRIEEAKRALTGGTNDES